MAYPFGFLHRARGYERIKESAQFNELRCRKARRGDELD